MGLDYRGPLVLHRAAHPRRRARGLVVPVARWTTFALSVTSVIAFCAGYLIGVLV